MNYDGGVTLGLPETGGKIAYTLWWTIHIDYGGGVTLGQPVILGLGDNMGVGVPHTRPHKG